MKFQSFLAIFLLVVGLACLGVGIYSYQGKPGPVPTPTPQIVYVTPSPTSKLNPATHPEITRSVSEAKAIGPISVWATALWQKTGIMVTRGQTVRVTASGQVTWDPQLPMVGPNGAYPVAGLGRPPDFALPSGQAGSLLMRIGAVIYEIGTGKTIPISQGGEIEFMVNDRTWALGDNSGAFQVQVWIE